MEQEIDSILSCIPDVPEWSLTRYILTCDPSIVRDEFGSIVINSDRDFVSIIGDPRAKTMENAFSKLSDEATLLTQLDVVDPVQAVTGKRGEGAELHTLDGVEPSVARNTSVNVAFLEDIPKNLGDEELRAELEDAFETGKAISAAWVNNFPVSGCNFMS